MSDNQEMDKKERQKQQKEVPSSPGLATKMRATSLKAEDPIDQKLKEVKEHKPHFDDMTSYMCTLLTPVDGTTMTKKSVPVQQTSPGKPASPGRASSPGRGSSPAKPTSPAKHSASAKHSSPAKASPPANSTRSTPVARNSVPSGRSSLPPRQDFSLEPSTSGYSSSTRFNRLRRLEIEIPQSSLLYPFEESIQMPGSPILDPSEHNDKVQFMPATITHPANLVEIGSDHEVVNTWECSSVNPPLEEVRVVGNGLTMFIRNPDGSYDLYTGLQPAAPEAENANVREITFSDGPLVILTRDDEGKLTYDPNDTVIIDIADKSLFVLNTEES